MTTGTTVRQVQLSFFDKAIALASWCMAGATFLTLGWSVMAPDNPQGVVSIFAHSGSLAMLVQSTLLAGLMAAVVTAMAGRRLADTGTFAVALSLAVVSLQGAPARSLGVLNSSVPDTSQRGLALLFAIETLGWFIVVFTALVISAWVMRRLFATQREHEDGQAALEAFAAHTVAAGDLPLWGTKLYGVPVEERTQLTEGLRHVAIVAIGVFLFMSLFGSAMNTRSAQHGQVLFMVWAAVAISAYIGHRLVPVRSALWSILAVPVAAIATYLWASVQTTGTGSLPNIPTAAVLRVLPIQFVGAGAATAIAVFWSMYKPHVAWNPSDEDKPT